MASVLNWLIPAALLAYAGWLIMRMIRQKGTGCTGCSSCPMAGSCSKNRKEEPQK